MGPTQELQALFQQSFHYLLGMAATAGLGFISLPIFTRVFTVSDYGTIDLVQRIGLFAVSLSKGGLQHAALRFHDGVLFRASPEMERRHYSTFLLSAAAISAGVALVYSLVTLMGSGRWFGVELTSLLLLGGLLVGIRPVQSILTSFLRAEERTLEFVGVLLSNKAATILAACALLLLFGAHPAAYFAGAAIAEGVVAGVLLHRVTRRSLVHWDSHDTDLMRAGLLFGLPLISYEMAFVVLSSADRFLVRSLLDAQSLGYYSLACGLSQELNALLIGPLQLAIVPIYLRLWSTRGREETAAFLSAGLDAYWAVAAGICCLVALCARHAVVVISSAKFEPAAALIPLLVFGMLVFTGHVIMCAGLFIEKRTGVIALIVLGGAALDIALNVLLLPRLGLQAAAISSAASGIACTGGMWFASAKYLRLRLNFEALAMYGGAAAATWFALHRIDAGSALVTLLARGAGGAILYGGLLWMMDRRVRRVWGELARWCSWRFSDER
ncbi:MAG: lipopolysaccharide biosynthesis protein [Acidobacteria bacterium]|nr:lipopolysaccharide biosynthesis protein [Acidobacteriota bacterium]